MKSQELSILIPTYNDSCRELVRVLRRQAEQTDIRHEIIVADDGSTDEHVVAENQEIGRWRNCRYLRRPQNTGRAAVRNYLAQQAQYENLLFIDGDMTVTGDDYIKRYAQETTADVVDGGVTIGGDSEMLRGNLRYRYEKAAETAHTVERRRESPYHDFHTANFLIRRKLMLSHPFDERFRLYGYEDVLFGKTLRASKIGISHIDNPVVFDTFEDNDVFVSKTEEGLQTLHRFHNELRGYSRLLTLVDGIHISLIISLIRLFHRLFGRLERRLLCGHHPNLRVFNLYRLGYYITLK